VENLGECTHACKALSKAAFLLTWFIFSYYSVPGSHEEEGAEAACWHCCVSAMSLLS